MNRKDTSEYLLHDFVSIGLIFFSYSLNLMHVGSIVMLVHDLPDIFVSSLKVVVGLYGLVPTVMNVLNLLFSWNFFRIYYLMYWIILVIYEEL